MATICTSVTTSSATYYVKPKPLLTDSLFFTIAT